LTPRLVDKSDMTAVGVLNGLRGNSAMIGGPALGGILIAAYGPASTYMVDVLSFLISLYCLLKIRRIPPVSAAEKKKAWSSVLEGLKYAASRQDLLGTYIVDFTAMVFAMPNALFPAIAAQFHSPKMLGALYAAPSVGALLVTVLLGDFFKPVKRHGAAILGAAFFWGLSISAAGFAPRIEYVLLGLGFSGAFDMVSAIFRQRIWNETIPDNLRGRLAGVEMISYLSGPQLGTAQIGVTASMLGIPGTLRLGGAVCMVGVAAAAKLLPKFRRYRA
jgi:MFS family permease